MTIFIILYTFIVIILSLLAITATEIKPYLVISMHNQPVDTIQVSLAQNISLDCIVKPNNHKVLWQAKKKQMKPSIETATLNLFNVDISDLGIYTCISPTSNLKKKVHIIVKKRLKRDYHAFEFLERKDSYDDISQMRKHFQNKYGDDWENHDMHDWKDKHDFSNFWNNEIDNNHWNPIDDEDVKDVQGQKSFWKIIGVVIGVIAIVGGIMGAIWCIASKNSQRTSAPPQTNTNNTIPPFRSIQTHISSYPPQMHAPSAPIDECDINMRTRVVNTRTAPPPSYDEVMKNTVSPIVSTKS